jgi:hypothetical protein
MICADLVTGLTEPSFAVLVIIYGFVKVFFAEIRPEFPAEIKF